MTTEATKKIPKFETAEDLSNEEAIAKIVQPALGFTEIKKLAFGRYRLDYVGLRHGVVEAWLEIKDRDHVYGTHDTLIISANKIAVGAWYAQTFDKDFFLCVRWACKRVGVWRFLDGRVKYGAEMKWGGASEKSKNGKEHEPLLYLPLEQFEMIQYDPDGCPIPLGD